MRFLVSNTVFVTLLTSLVVSNSAHAGFDSPSPKQNSNSGKSKSKKQRTYNFADSFRQDPEEESVEEDDDDDFDRMLGHYKPKRKIPTCDTAQEIISPSKFGAILQVSNSFGSPSRGKNNSRALTAAPSRRAIVGRNPTIFYDYCELSQFKSGDILYGLDISRKYTIESIEKGCAGQPPNKNPTVNLFNNTILNSINAGEFPREFESGQEVDQAIEELANRSYREGKFSSQHEKDRFAKYAKFYYSQERYSPAKNKPDKHNRDSGALFISRACKTAILFTQSEGKKIHFVLDHLDVNASLNPNRNYHSFTSIELRSVFKSWLVDPTILDTVKFYQNGRVIDAPWLDDSGHLTQEWQTYKDDKS